MKQKADGGKFEAAVAKVILEEIRQILKTAYEDAGISGLCDEGRFEAALGALNSAAIEKILMAQRRKK
ncbi:MAG: acetyltransferase [Bdellovibrionales bacterium]